MEDYEQSLKKELTPLERRFVLELIKDGNRAAAAERAGCKGTKNTFKKLGAQMIAKPHVKKAYDDLNAKVLDKAMVTRDTLINQIQDTIMEARAAQKFDAAFKGFGQLGEIIGVLGKTKHAKDDAKAGQLKPEEAFNQGEDSVDQDDDITKFLKLTDFGKKAVNN